VTKTDRIVACVLLGVALAVGVPVANPARASETIQATTTVNVRSGPSTSSTIIGFVAWGYTIEATGPSDNGWTPVDYGGRAGYVSSQYFVTPGATTAYDGPKGEAWTTAYLNVRNGPSTSHTRLDTLPTGAKVTLTGRVLNGFSQIVWYHGQRAWVAADWLDSRGTADPDPGPPVEPEPEPTPEPEATTAAPEPEDPADDPIDPPADPGPDPIADPEPTDEPTAEPSAEPTDEPTAEPTDEPTEEPAPDPEPTAEPTPEPTPADEPPSEEPETPDTPTIVGQKRAGADLNLRATDQADSAILAVIPYGSTLDLTGDESNGRLPVWWQGQAGWVSKDYVTELGDTGPATPPEPVATGTRYTTDTLNVRSGPGTDHSVVGTLTRGQEVSITGNTSGVWYEIVYNGAARWVSGDYLATEPPAPSSAGQIAADFAKTKVGLPYVWGGNGPDGYDCSGLTRAAYLAAGIAIPRVAADQATYGYPVSRADIQVGDLVFYYSPISHVAIYVGDGQVVHASTYGVGVVYSSVDMTTITAIRRYT
jgi:cell wall-associated NlpC family hydrolase